MSNQTNDSDIDLIQDEIASITTKAHHERTIGNKKIKIRSSVELARDNYKLAKRTHKAEIKKLKAKMRLERKIARNNIKAHRNLIATARTSYKAIKLADRK